MIFLQRQTNSQKTHEKMLKNTRQSIPKSTIFFSVEDGKALYDQQKRDQELTVAQVMKSVLQNSGSN